MTRAAKGRKVAIALAFAGALPTPLPLTWLHKFYLGQYLWGIVYLVLAPTLLPQIACCLEGVWYLSQSDAHFSARFPQSETLLAAHSSGSSSGPSSEDSKNSKVSEVGSHRSAPGEAAQQMAIALRELDQLRQEGLMTEYEFEQKRRKLLADIA